MVGVDDDWCAIPVVIPEGDIHIRCIYSPDLLFSFVDDIARIVGDHNLRGNWRPIICRNVDPADAAIADEVIGNCISRTHDAVTRTLLGCVTDNTVDKEETRHLDNAEKEEEKEETDQREFDGALAPPLRVGMSGRYPWVS